MEWNFEKLSLDQLSSLMKELGPIPVLLKEHNTKLLMRQINGMERALACLLTDAQDDPWNEGNEDPRASQLAALFVRNGFTQAQLTSLRLHCAPGGQKVWNRACRRYFNDYSYRARQQSGQEVLDHVFKSQDGSEFSGKEASKAAEDFTSDFQDPESVYRQKQGFGVGVHSCQKTWGRRLGIPTGGSRGDGAESRPGGRPRGAMGG